MPLEKQIVGLIIMFAGIFLVLIHPVVKPIPINIELGKFRYQGGVGGILVIIGALHATCTLSTIIKILSP